MNRNIKNGKSGKNKIWQFENTIYYVNGQLSSAHSNDVENRIKS